MPEVPPAASAHPTSVQASVRAQILATEHWSLLATRSMTWSEVMSRIVIQLTVMSAVLVVLALIVQANGFGFAFQVLSIGLAVVVLVLGTLTGVRVRNASADDAAMIVGMNRLRAAYIELDPGIEPYFVTSPFDDDAGLMTSYLMGRRRSMASHIVGSTSMFVNAVNAIVAGALGGLIAYAADGPAWLISIVGGFSCLGYLGASIGIGRRTFRVLNADIRFPSPPPGT
jgi:hypothetical protein